MIVGPCQSPRKASSIRLVGLQEHGRPISFCHRHHRSITQAQLVYSIVLQFKGRRTQ